MSRYATRSPWSYRDEQPEDDLFYASEEALRQASTPPDMEEALARIDAKLAARDSAYDRMLTATLKGDEAAYQKAKREFWGDAGLDV